MPKTLTKFACEYCESVFTDENGCISHESHCDKKVLLTFKYQKARCCMHCLNKECPIPSIQKPYGVYEDAMVCDKFQKQMQCKECGSTEICCSDVGGGDWCVDHCPSCAVPSQSPPVKIEYPATITAHWSDGPYPCCQKHAEETVELGRVIGLHVALTELTEPAECINCVNENKEGEASDEESTT